MLLAVLLHPRFSALFLFYAALVFFIGISDSQPCGRKAGSESDNYEKEFCLHGMRC